LSRAGRKELLSRERGCVLKKWTNRSPVCVVFPNTYYIGMSNLAVHLIYRELNSRPDVVCERVFLAPGEKPLSVESGRPLGAFEVVFFTLSFEMDYPNVIAMLLDSAIPIDPMQRGRGDPLIVGGGVCVMANPEPMSPFFDLFIMGDVEACLPPFIERYLEARKRERGEALNELSSWPWVYNPARLRVAYGEDGTVQELAPPGFGVEIERYRGKSLAASAIIARDTEFSDMLLVEGARGCPSACAFCLAGNIHPFIVDRLEKIGSDSPDVGIIGGGVSFHPHLSEIIRRLTETGVRVHLPSLRLDEAPLEVIDMIRKTIKTLTFGIEAGTEALRRRLGKPFSDEEIAGRIEAIAEMAPFHFKFYFMVGLPGESREDVDAIVDLVKRILHLLVKKGGKKGRIGAITVHASPFVPKAATPFQWLAMDEAKLLKEKLSILARGLGRVANTHFTHESVKYSFLQGVFARGDRRLKDAIIRFAKGETLSAVMRESPLNLHFYAARERRENEIFPWDFIGGTAEKTLLLRRLRVSLPGFGQEERQ
jgi:radical SAM superfamily enzyme YgiQ (UPF0313 family)